MRWRNIGLLTVALLALGNAVTAQDKAKAVVPQDKPKVDPLVREQEEKERFARRREELKRVLQEVTTEEEAHQDELAMLRAKIGDLTGLRDRNGVKEVLGPLQTDVQRLRVEVAGLAARKDALELAIAKTAREGRDLASSDPIARELAKLVSLREEAVEALRKDAHEARIVAMAQLVETRIKLEERLANLRTGAVSNAKFAERLMDTTITLAESQARLKQSEVLLSKLNSPELNRLLDRELLLADRTSRLRSRRMSLEVGLSEVRLER